MALDTDLEQILALIGAGPPLYEQTPVQARAAFRALTVDLRPPGSVPAVGSVRPARIAGAAGDLDARVYRPERADPGPTIVLFHGGGWVLGDLDTHDGLARMLCVGTGAVVVSVSYRLAPEHPFPAAALDAIAATRDVHRRRAEFGGTGLVAVAGDSAGGNLAAVAAQRVPEVRAQFLIYPATHVAGDYASREQNGTGYFLDLPTMAWFLGCYLPDGGDLDDPLLSPLLGPLTGLAPAIVVTAELDPLRDEGIAYAAALETAGVRVVQHTYPGMIHGFIDMGPWSTGAQAAVQDAVGRFAEVLAVIGPTIGSDH